MPLDALVHGQASYCIPFFHGTDHSYPRQGVRERSLGIANSNSSLLSGKHRLEEILQLLCGQLRPPAPLYCLWCVLKFFTLTQSALPNVCPMYAPREDKPTRLYYLLQLDAGFC